MKRTILTLITVSLLSGFLTAQTAEHVLGIRFGTGIGFGTEISYQHGLTDLNRLELDLGFSNHHEYQASNQYSYNNWGLTGLYHWVKKINTNMNWYLGPGAKVGSWSYSQGANYEYSNGFFLVAAGDIGMEYLFPVGIQLALNARPEIGLINHGTVINVGFAIRYQFGQARQSPTNTMRASN
jgi:hypothetical protein